MNTKYKLSLLLALGLLASDGVRGDSSAWDRAQNLTKLIRTKTNDDSEIYRKLKTSIATLKEDFKAYNDIKINALENGKYKDFIKDLLGKTNIKWSGQDLLSILADLESAKNADEKYTKSFENIKKELTQISLKNGADASSLIKEDVTETDLFNGVKTAFEKIPFQSLKVKEMSAHLFRDLTTFKREIAGLKTKLLNLGSAEKEKVHPNLKFLLEDGKTESFLNNVTQSYGNLLSMLDNAAKVSVKDAATIHGAAFDVKRLKKIIEGTRFIDKAGLQKVVDSAFNDGTKGLKTFLTKIATALNSFKSDNVPQSSAIKPRREKLYYLVNEIFGGLTDTEKTSKVLAFKSGENNTGSSLAKEKEITGDEYLYAFPGFFNEADETSLKKEFKTGSTEASEVLAEGSGDDSVKKPFQELLDKKDTKNEEYFSPLSFKNPSVSENQWKAISRIDGEDLTQISAYKINQHFLNIETAIREKKLTVENNPNMVEKIQKHLDKMMSIVKKMEKKAQYLKNDAIYKSTEFTMFDGMTKKNIKDEVKEMEAVIDKIKKLLPAAPAVVENEDNAARAAAERTSAERDAALRAARNAGPKTQKGGRDSDEEDSSSDDEAFQLIAETLAHLDAEGESIQYIKNNRLDVKEIINLLNKVSESLDAKIGKMENKNEEQIGKIIDNVADQIISNYEDDFYSDKGNQRTKDKNAFIKIIKSNLKHSTRETMIKMTKLIEEKIGTETDAYLENGRLVPSKMTELVGQLEADLKSEIQKNSTQRDKIIEQVATEIRDQFSLTLANNDADDTAKESIKTLIKSRLQPSTAISGTVPTVQNPITSVSAVKTTGRKRGGIRTNRRVGRAGRARPKAAKAPASKKMLNRRSAQTPKESSGTESSGF